MEKTMDLNNLSMKKIRELIVFTAFLVIALWKFDILFDVLKTAGRRHRLCHQCPHELLRKEALWKSKGKRNEGRRKIRAARKPASHPYRDCRPPYPRDVWSHSPAYQDHRNSNRKHHGLYSSDADLDSGIFTQ